MIPKVRFPGLERVDPVGNHALVEVLASQMRSKGPMTFARFMHRVLYDAEYGYYVHHNGAGRGRGDYLTAPQVHPAFGGALACQLVELWEVLERPDPFDVVEFGAGDLRLAADLRDWVGRISPEAYRALRYTAVDLRTPQQRPDAVEFRLADPWPLSDRLTGVVLSNELLDAFGVHRLRYDGERWRELRVGYDDQRECFQWVDAAPTVEAPRIVAVPGQIVEVNPGASAWITQVASSLQRGFVLTLDYGDEAHKIFRPDRAEGTLRCFARHRVHNDPFKYVGEQDLTADVDFTAVVEAGVQAGLVTAGYTSQAEFLGRWGLAEVAEHLGHAELQSDSIVANRGPIGHLLDPEGLGRVRVLLQARDVAARPLTGFDDDAPESAYRLRPDRFPRIEPPNVFADLLG